MANAAFKQLVFEELDQKRRKVTLKGTEAPQGHVRGEPAFKLGGPLRKKKKLEPGNNIPVVHITGSEQHPIEVRIHERDSLTGESGRALGRLHLIEDVKEAGRTLRIVWGTEVRYGILDRTDWEVEGEGEIKGTLVFDPVWRATSKRSFTKKKKSIGLPNDLIEVSDLTSKVRSSFALGTLRITPAFETNFGSLFSALAKPITDLLHELDIFTSAIDDARADADAVRRRLEQIAAHALNAIRRIEDLAGFLSAQEGPEVADEIAARKAWERARHDAMVALADLQTRCVDIGAGAEQRLRGTATSIYTARAGDTLEIIAARFSLAVATLRALNPELGVGALRAGTKVRLP